ncbi:MAG: hypothetical protein AAB874_08270 [Patescibacteria group bacterium]
MNNVVLIHDRTDIGPLYAIFLGNMGHKVIFMKNEAEVKNLLSKALRVAEVVILHKDFGEVAGGELSSDQICNAIHDEAPYIRIGISSGEYPDGINHVLMCKADFYLNSTHLTGDWSLKQIEKGYTTPQEQSQRGSRVEIPSGYLGKGERFY